jgi:hypothetical protein
MKKHDKRDDKLRKQPYVREFVRTLTVGDRQPVALVVSFIYVLSTAERRSSTGVRPQFGI